MSDSPSLKNRWVNTSNQWRKKVKMLILMEVPWEGVVSGSGPPAVLPRQRWLRLNLWKSVVARLHITYQSMCAILLDKLNKLLLFLCHGAKIDSICEGFPKAVQVIFLGTSTEIYRAKQPWGCEGDHIVLLITQIWNDFKKRLNFKKNPSFHVNTEELRLSSLFWYCCWSELFFLFPFFTAGWAIYSKCVWFYSRRVRRLYNLQSKSVCYFVSQQEPADS